MFYIDLPDERGNVWRYLLNEGQFVDLQRQVHETHIQAMRDAGHVVEVLDVVPFGEVVG